MADQGWTFSNYPESIPDTINNFKYLHQVYTAAKHDYTGRVTVPVLWDKKTKTIVNNESAEIIRMFNSEFNAYGDVSKDFYPEKLRAEIDAINEIIYEKINNGVYLCGFATTQVAYETAFNALFIELDKLEERLAKQKYLIDNVITEADWRLFTTLIRFDAVYYSHFKCNLRRIIDYPNLFRYMQKLYQIPGIAATVNFDHIKTHYYKSHKQINPTGIVPKGPKFIV